jgi:hypothetical protein
MEAFHPPPAPPPAGDKTKKPRLCGALYSFMFYIHQNIAPSGNPKIKVKKEESAVRNTFHILTIESQI